MKDKRKEDFIDVKSVFYNFLSYWYYFLLSFLIFISAGYLYNRYKTPQWAGDSTILIRDESSDLTKSLIVTSVAFAEIGAYKPNTAGATSSF